ncbi:MAG: hypothetical protein ACFFCS_27105 [Candidatus Hodarchaeota archaeon]
MPAPLLQIATTLPRKSGSPSGAIKNARKMEFIIKKEARTTTTMALITLFLDLAMAFKSIFLISIILYFMNARAACTIIAASSYLFFTIIVCPVPPDRQYPSYYMKIIRDLA